MALIVAIRLSTYIIIPDKNQEIVIKNVLELWISVYEDHNGGDNGEEFVNEETFRTNCTIWNNYENNIS